MNKTDLIQKICDKTGSSKAKVTRILNQTFEIIKESAKEDEKVTVRGFGAFELKNCIF